MDLWAFCENLVCSGPVWKPVGKRRQMSANTPAESSSQRRNKKPTACLQALPSF